MFVQYSHSIGLRYTSTASRRSGSSGTDVIVSSHIYCVSRLKNYHLRYSSRFAIKQVKLFLVFCIFFFCFATEMTCEVYPALSKHFSFDRRGCEFLPLANLFFSYEYVNVRCLKASNVEVSCCPSSCTKGQKYFML
jgi:hypothetical protein